MAKSWNLKGFMLLPSSSEFSYLGVDRGPFEPSLIDSEIDYSMPVQKGETKIWAFYPPGWRQNAYRIYEENLVKGGETDCFLLSSLDATIEIQQILAVNLQNYDILECEIGPLDCIHNFSGENNFNFLGCDIAYPGGDYYSAIKNGLFCNPHPLLVSEYKHLLNENGLFNCLELVTKYLMKFRQLTISEANADFCVYRLFRVGLLERS